MCGIGHWDFGEFASCAHYVDVSVVCAEADDPYDPGSYEIDVLPPPVVVKDEGADEAGALLSATSSGGSAAGDSALMSSVAVESDTLPPVSSATSLPATTAIAARPVVEKARMRKTNSVERLAGDSKDD